MDNLIKQSIEARRQSLYSMYNLPDSAKEHAETVFARMEQLGNDCAGPAEFEKLLLLSSFNEDYNNLFVQYARHVIKPDSTPSTGEMVRRAAADQARSTAAHQAEVQARGIIFRMLPEWAQNWSLYGIYNVPVLGNIVSTLNRIEMIQRLFGTKPEDEDEDEEPKGKHKRTKKKH